jgi:capsular exopolysaccharide synthesis family protein
MSKVYEALRRKQQETSRPLTFDSLDGELANMIECANSEAAAESDGSMLISPDSRRRITITKRESSRLVFQTDPHGLAAEQFRFLRRALEQRFPKGALLLITSPAPRDGKTLTSINLSACLAESGKSTLLLEGDIRQPAIAKVLGTSGPGHGIEDALTGAADAAETVHYVEDLSFCVSMVANPPADPARVIAGKGSQKLFAWARQHFHWVVLDSPPVFLAADVAHLATLTDTVLLVVRAQSTPRYLVNRAFELFGDRLYGVLMNEATVASNPHYRYLADYRYKGNTFGRKEDSST